LAKEVQRGQAPLAKEELRGQSFLGQRRTSRSKLDLPKSVLKDLKNRKKVSKKRIKEIEKRKRKRKGKK
jgi:hypothetical protein